MVLEKYAWSEESGSDPISELSGGDPIGEVGGIDAPDDTSTTEVLPIGGSIQGNIGVFGDRDWARVTLTAGQSYLFTLNGTGASPLVDPFLRLYDANGVLITFDDDGGPGSNSALRYTPSVSGAYYIAAAAFEEQDPHVGAYTLTAAAVPRQDPLKTIDWGTKLNSTVIRVYFAHPGETFDEATASRDWTAFEKQQLFAAAATWSAVTNVTFTEVSSAAQATMVLVLADSSIDAIGWMTVPPSLPNVGAFDPTGPWWTNGGGLDPGGEGFQAMVHELGHALGLAHPHDDGGSSQVLEGVTDEFNSYGVFGLNQGVYTVMSYNDGWDLGPGGGATSYGSGAESTPMALDIAVVQQKYGAAVLNAGDTSYNLDTVQSQYQAIWDSGGNDTVFTNSSTNTVIDLRPATLQLEDGGGGFVSYYNTSSSHGGFTIAAGVTIENATSGAGNDHLIGNSAANVLTSGAGNDWLEGGAGDDILKPGLGDDTIDGGAGADTVSYAEIQSGVTISLRNPAPQITGGAGNDTVLNVENLIGTAFNDVLADSSVANRIDAGPGFDTVSMIGTRGSATWSRNVDGSWAVSSATDGADTFIGVEMVKFSDADLSLRPLSADFNADLYNDLLFIRTDRQLANWQLNGASIINSGSMTSVPTGWRIVATGDYTGDGRSDILIADQLSNLQLLRVNGAQVTADSVISLSNYSITAVGGGDFNGDGSADVLFRTIFGVYASKDFLNGQIVGGLGRAGPTNVNFRGTGDFDGDGHSDVLFQDASGAYSMWIVHHENFIDTVAVGNPGGQWSFAGVGDFDADGKSDILFQDTSGMLAIWRMNGAQIVSSGNIGNPGAAWTLIGVSDYNSDGRSDLLFRNANGSLATWSLNGNQIVGGANIGDPGSAWLPVSQDAPYSFPSLLFQNSNGTYATWTVNGITQIGGGALGAAAGFIFKAIGDFNGDGVRDIAFQAADGTVATWMTNGNQLTGGSTLGSPGAAWALVASGDFSGDGNSDLLFKNVDGRYATWDVHLGSVIGGGDIGSANGFTVVGTGDLDGDGHDDILFRNDATGDLAAWMMNDTQIRFGANIGNPGGTWTVRALGDLNGDGMADIVFQDASGMFAAWDMNGGAIIGGGNIANPGAGWTFKDLVDVNGDHRMDLVFQDASGTVAEWQMLNTSIVGGGTIGNPGAGWTFLG